MPTERYEMGSPVRCSDGPCGTLGLVVVDPVKNRLAHLVVVPHRGADSRLVPVAMARAAHDGVVLDCTVAEFERLEVAVISHYVPAEDADGRWGYRHDEIMSLPYYGLGPMGPDPGRATPPRTVTAQLSMEDRVPAGEVRIHRGEHVHAADGVIGRVRGLVVDPADDSVTHVLLDEGHLWGHKQVAIPMGAVGGIDEDGVTVRLTKQEIKELPSIAVVGPA